MIEYWFIINGACPFRSRETSITDVALESCPPSNQTGECGIVIATIIIMVLL